jgi:signal transduction histidine kinase
VTTAQAPSAILSAILSVIWRWRARLAASRRSLVERLVLAAVGWCLVLLIVAGAALTGAFNHAAVARLDQSLLEDADDLYAGAAVGPLGEVFAPALTDVRATRAYSGKYWQLAERGEDGALHSLARSRSMFDAEDLPVRPFVLKALRDRPGGGVSYDAEGPDRQALRIFAMQRVLSGRAKPVVFMTAQDRGPIDRDARSFALTTAAALLLLGAGLVLAVVLQVRFGLAPLFAMRRDLADVREGRAEALCGAYPTELEPLAHELNALLKQNREVVERQRTHVGNLAHALKTPIAALLMEVKAQPGPFADLVQRQVEAMRGHVDHHLRRARAAARTSSLGERTAVAPVIEELSRLMQKLYRTKDLDVELGADALHFAGERQDLLEMVGNLFENACKWSRTAVKLSVVVRADRKFAVIVEDDGPGLLPEKRADVLRRGERLDEDAPGSGLGLAIVNDLARAYSGALGLDDSALGGLKVTLELPRTEV